MVEPAESRVLEALDIEDSPRATPGANSRSAVTRTSALSGLRQRGASVIYALAAKGRAGDEDGILEEDPWALEDTGVARRDSQQMIDFQVAKIKDVTHQTLVGLDATNDLDQTSWLQRARMLVVQGSLLIFYVFIDTTKGLTNKWVMEDGKVQASALVLLNTTLSVAIGLGITVYFEGKEKAKACLLDLQAIKQFALVSALFCFSTILNIMAYATTLDAGTIKILGQLRLPLAAFMSRSVLGRKYSFNHWMVLLLITLTALTFFLGIENRQEVTSANLKAMKPEECFMDYDPRHPHRLVCTIVGEDAPTKPGMLLGLMYVLGWIFFVTVASLVAEKFFKATFKTPFYIQKMQMEMSGMWVSIFMAFIVPLFVQGGAWDPNNAKRLWWTSTELDCVGGWKKTVGGNGLFEGFGGKAFIQLLTAVLQGWLGGIVVKKFSTVVKNIAKSLSLILTVFSNEIFFTECWAESLSAVMYMLSISIFCSTMVFSQLGEDGEKPPPAQKPAGDTRTGLPPISAGEHRKNRKGSVQPLAAVAELGEVERPPPPSSSSGGTWNAASAAEEEMAEAMAAGRKGPRRSQWNSGIQIQQ